MIVGDDPIVVGFEIERGLVIVDVFHDVEFSLFASGELYARDWPTGGRSQEPL